MNDQLDNEVSNAELKKRLDKVEARTRSSRGWRRVALALIVLAVSLPLAADALAPVPNLFGNGQVISASEMNTNFGHLQDAITAVENRLATLEGQPTLPTCVDGEVAYKTGGAWTCDSPDDIVDADALLRTKMAWGIVYTSGSSCSVQESSIAGLTCTFSNGTFTINTPGWATHYLNDIVTANASWCQNCGNFGIRVDPLSGTESMVISLTSYVSGTARVNFALIKK